ncbi:MAG: hypothetical protein IT288_01335 [Bdellovibrionales bacterium]|nr:hypothetical protein [Bdellovibrionales bacterium]
MGIFKFQLFTAILLGSLSAGNLAEAQGDGQPQLRGLVLTAKEIPEELLASGPPKKLPVKRGPATFSAGYRVTKVSCAFFKVPNPMSSRAGNLDKGTKIWLEGVDLEWTRGVYKNHSIFVPAKCLE